MHGLHGGVNVVAKLISICDNALVSQRRGAERAEDAQETLTQSYTSPSILVYEETNRLLKRKELFQGPTYQAPITKIRSFSHQDLTQAHDLRAW